MTAMPWVCDARWSEALSLPRGSTFAIWLMPILSASDVYVHTQAYTLQSSCLLGMFLAVV